MDYLKYVQEQFHYDGDAEICEQMKRVVVNFSILASDLPGFDSIREVMNWVIGLRIQGPNERCKEHEERTG